MKRSELTEKMLAASGQCDAQAVLFISGRLRKLVINYDEPISEDKAKEVEQILARQDARDLAWVFCSGLLSRVYEHFNVRPEDITGYRNN